MLQSINASLNSLSGFDILILFKFLKTMIKMKKTLRNIKFDLN